MIMLELGDDHFSFPRRRLPFPNQPGAKGFVGDSPFTVGRDDKSPLEPTLLPTFPFFVAFPAFSESLDAPMVGESSRL